MAKCGRNRSRGWRRNFSLQLKSETAIMRTAKPNCLEAAPEAGLEENKESGPQFEVDRPRAFEMLGVNLA
jgi:hypothetical protein